jgi:hypothetical protein
MVEWPQILTKVNECCDVPPAECTARRSLYDQVMRATNVLLNTDASPAIERRWVRWTIYENLLAWFKIFWTFLTELDSARVGSDGELDINEEQLHWILNVIKTEIAIDGSQMIAGGRPAMSFHNPHLPLSSMSVAKSSLACTGIFGSNAAGKCKPPHRQLPTDVTTAQVRRVKHFGVCSSLMWIFFLRN